MKEEGSMNMSKLSMGYGLAVDTHTGHAIISDPGNNLLVIVDLNKELAAFFYVGTSKGVGQVTIDWRARNVYWTDAGYLFWADAGKHPKIERSDMTGNGRIVIVWQGLITPRALAIDNQGDKLFWTDEDRETIEFCNFDGTGRNILISNGLQYYGIDVYQSYVFYSAFYRETANTTYTGYIHTTNWKDQSHRVLQNKTLYHVAVYDRASQPRDPLGERCENAYTNCSQICIHEDDNGNTACLCLDGYDLDRFQGRACYDGGYNVERHLLFTNSHSICAIAINAFTAHDSIKGFPYNCSVIRGSYGEITRFSIDTAGRNIFFTNSTHILMQTPFLSEKRTVYNMDFDWLTRTLYWIESDSSALHFIKPYSTETSIKLKKLRENGQLTNLAVDPLNRKIYFVVRSRDDSFELNVYDAATETVTTVEVNNLRRPTDLEYDRLQERLVWNDDGGFIGFLALGDRKQIPKVETNGGKKRHAITPYKQFIFSSTEEAKRQFDVLYEGDQSMIYTSFSSIYDTFVHDMHVYDKTLQPSETATKTDFSSEVYAVDIHTDNAPVSLAFDSDSSTIAWVDESITRTVKVKKLGQNDERIVEFNMMENGYVAIDSSTGNVYVLSANKINVINENGKVHELVDDSLTENIEMKTIALLSSHGKMAWIATQTGRWMIFLANMDRTNRKLAIQSESMIDDLIFDVETASRCPVVEEESISVLDDCCPEQPDALCKVTCADGFTQVSPYKLKCQPTGWNASIEELCTEGSKPPNTWLMIGIASFALVLVVIAVVAFIIHRKRSSKFDRLDEQYVVAYRHDILAYDSDHVYDPANAIARNKSADRNSRVQSECYADLDETVILAESVDLPTKHEKQSRGRNDYHPFPTSQIVPPNLPDREKTAPLMDVQKSLSKGLSYVSFDSNVYDISIDDQYDRLGSNRLSRSLKVASGYGSTQNVSMRGQSINEGPANPQNHYSTLLKYKKDNEFSAFANDNEGFSNKQSASFVNPSFEDDECTCGVVEFTEESSVPHQANFVINGGETEFNDETDYMEASDSKDMEYLSNEKRWRRPLDNSTSEEQSFKKQNSRSGNDCQQRNDLPVIDEKTGSNRGQNVYHPFPSSEDLSRDLSTEGTEFHVNATIATGVNHVKEIETDDYMKPLDYQHGMVKETKLLERRLQNHDRSHNHYHPFPSSECLSTFSPDNDPDSNYENPNFVEDDNLTERHGGEAGKPHKFSDPSTVDIQRVLDSMHPACQKPDCSSNVDAADNIRISKHDSNYQLPDDYFDGYVEDNLHPPSIPDSKNNLTIQNHSHETNSMIPRENVRCNESPQNAKDLGLNPISKRCVPVDDDDDDYLTPVPDEGSDDYLTLVVNTEARDGKGIEMQQHIDHKHQNNSKNKVAKNSNMTDKTNDYIPMDKYRLETEPEFKANAAAERENIIPMKQNIHDIKHYQEGYSCLENNKKSSDDDYFAMDRFRAKTYHNPKLMHSLAADNENVERENGASVGHNENVDGKWCISTNKRKAEMGPFQNQNSYMEAEAAHDEMDDYLPMKTSISETDDNRGDDYLPMNSSKAEADNNEGDDYLPMKGLKAKADEADGNEGDDYLPMNSSKAKADDNAGDDYLPMNSLKAEADANEGDDYLPMDGLKAEAANNEGDDYLPMKGLKAETDNNEGDDYLPMKDLKAEADNNEGEDYLPMKVLKAEADNNEGDDYLPMNGLKAEADNNEGDDYLPMNGLKAEADNNEGDDYLPMKDLKAEADNNERDDYLPMKDLKAEADNNEGDDYLPMKGLKAETDYNERDDYLPMNGSNAESNAYEGGDYLPMKGLKSEADANEGDDYLPMNGLKAEADANEGDDYLPMY
ncbi:LRP4-like protein, partial [Mya arenaria]